MLILYKMNDDLLLVNFCKCLFIIYDSYGGLLLCGEGGGLNICYMGIILYVFLLNVMFLDFFGCRSF